MSFDIAQHVVAAGVSDVASLVAEARQGTKEWSNVGNGGEEIVQGGR